MRLFTRHSHLSVKPGAHVQVLTRSCDGSRDGSHELAFGRARFCWCFGRAGFSSGAGPLVRIRRRCSLPVVLVLSVVPCGDVRGKAGMTNLGNTCFLSSAVQCLSHVLPLTQHILSNAFMDDVNSTNPLGEQASSGQFRPT